MILLDRDAVAQCLVSGHDLLAIFMGQEIDWYRTEHGLSPSGINAGYCAAFAETLVSMLHGAGVHRAFIVDASEVATRLRHGEGEHVWTYFEGRHYDAETPAGVSDWRDLPFFSRWYKKRRRPSRQRSTADERRALDVIAGLYAKLYEKLDREIEKRRHEERELGEAGA